MFDGLQLPRESPDLLRLLDHYVEAVGEERDRWQDRRMAMEGVEAHDLVKLHGLLIAFDWLEQNTGSATAVRAEAVPDCYRVTTAGLRMAKLARGGVPDDAESSREEEQDPQLRRPRATLAA
jgi:hypothetical protein